MEEKYKVIKRVRKNGTSLAINIPKEIIDLMEINEGDLLEVEIRRIKDANK